MFTAARASAYSNGASRCSALAEYSVSAFDEIYGDKAAEWKCFKAQWLNYLTAAKLTDEPDERKVALLLACIGADGFALFDGLPFATDDDRQNITRVLEAYESQFVPQKNVCYQKMAFQRAIPTTR